jgi:hypothetical protein
MTIRDHFAVTDDLIATGVKPLYLIRMLTYALGMEEAEKILTRAMDLLRTMTPGEAKAAYESAEPIPVSKERVDEIVKNVHLQAELDHVVQHGSRLVDALRPFADAYQNLIADEEEALSVGHQSPAEDEYTADVKVKHLRRAWELLRPMPDEEEDTSS